MEALRGAWDGSSTSPSVTQAKWSQRWHDGSGQVTLDPLGNWTTSWLDTTGSGFGSGNADVRTHDWLNRITHRDVGGVDLGDLSYDLAANLQEQVVEGTSDPTTYRHDAWSRLVEVRYDDVLRARYAYNALNWRAFKLADSTGTGGVPDGTMDQARLMYYSPDWRLLEERIDDAYASGDWDADTWTPDPMNWTETDIDRHLQYHWGIRYIDDLVLHRIDRNADGDYTDSTDGTWYHLTDAQFSTVCLLTPSAQVAERVTYSAYGIARHHWLGDIDGDGDVDTSGSSSDRGIITTIFNSGDNLIGEAEYRAEADLDRDGDVDGSDRTLAGSAKAAVVEGLITDASATGPDNQIGWDGYVFNGETFLYIVRRRHYDARLGTWAEVDPLGVRSTAPNVFAYVRSCPPSDRDPSGLDGFGDVRIREGRLPLPEPDVSIPPSQYNCAGLAFRSYEYLSLDDVKLILARTGRQLTSCSESCGPCALKCWLWEYDIEIREYREQPLPSGQSGPPSPDCKSGPVATGRDRLPLAVRRDFHIVCGLSKFDRSDPDDCYSKNGPRDIERDGDGKLRRGRAEDFKPVDSEVGRALGRLLCKNRLNISTTCYCADKEAVRR